MTSFMPIHRMLSKTIFELERQLIMFPQSRFGSVRKHDTHTGVDIYTANGEPVYAMEDGVVEKIEFFTGPSIGTPWWRDTQAVTIRTKNCLMLYGEIQPLERIEEGMEIKAGRMIGFVVQVLKQDKGMNPLNMLHFEMYTDHPVAVVWNLNEPKPINLIDPTEYLLKHFSKKGGIYGEDSRI